MVSVKKFAERLDEVILEEVPPGTMGWVMGLIGLGVGSRGHVLHSGINVVEVEFHTVKGVHFEIQNEYLKIESDRSIWRGADKGG